MVESPRVQDEHPLAGALYGELRALAAFHLQGERPEHTLRPTDIVHEAFLRLKTHLEREKLERTHLVALVSQCMRRVLVDHARARAAAKRPSSNLRVTLSDAARVTDRGFEDVLDLHLTLERFAEVDARAAQVTEMMLFGGFTQEEVAAHLGVSVRTVGGDFAIAKAWMRRELAGAGRPKRELPGQAVLRAHLVGGSERPTRASTPAAREAGT